MTSDVEHLPTKRGVPVILQAAQRAAAEPNAKRKTPRHALAFGLKVPLIVDEVRDFQLPDWRLLRERHGDLEDNGAMMHG
jgi:hypothetical protein